MRKFKPRPADTLCYVPDACEDLKMESGNIYLHVIDEDDDTIIMKRLVASVPRPNDEIRVGGEGNERYYKITRVVWVFDENSPWQRVNIGAKATT